MARPPVNSRPHRKLLRPAALGVALALFSAFPARSEVLLERAVVVTGEWPPYTSERAEGSGLLSSLVTEILKGMDRIPEYQFLPFSIALQRSRESGAVGTFPWFWNKQRAANFIYSDPILEVEYVIFFDRTAGSGIAELTRFEDLKNLSTKRVEGYAYGQLDCLLDHGVVDCPPDAGPPASDAPTAKSEFLAFQDLLDGQINYVAASRAVGEAILARSFSLEDRRKIAILEDPEFTWSMGIHFLFPRERADAEDLKRAFDDSLEEVAASGRVAELKQQLARSGWWRENIVRLEGFGDAPGGLVGRRSLDDETYVTLPRGTRAVVLEWSPALRGDETDVGSVSMSRVELLNGPLRGERLWVRDELLRLDGDLP